MTIRKSVGATALTLIISLSNQATAATNDDLLSAVESLKSQLEAQQKQISTLQAELKKQKAKPAPKSVQDNGVEVSLKPAPSFKSADGKTTFALDGRIAVDTGFSTNDDADLGDATDIRYLWLGMKGQVEEDWVYRFLVGLENDATTVNDAFIGYQGFDGVFLQAGNFKEFNGIENMSSNLHNTFVERSSATTTFRPLRTLGFGSTFYGDQWSLQLGAFGDDPGNTAGDDEGKSVTGRFVVAPIMEKDELLHLGVSARHRKPDADQDSVRFRSRGESNVIDGRLVDTGVIANVDDWQTYAVEGRYTYGPIAFMAEYNLTEVNRDGAADVEFDGGYVSASYFLTGEQRGYKVKNGTYGRVKPLDPFSLSEGGIGAWEIAARYSNLDLNDGPILGGELDAYTVGLNWYPTAYSKFMLNYVINETDQNGTTPNNDPHLIMLRSQIDF